MWRQAIIETLDGTHPTIGPRIALVIYGLMALSAVVIAVETMPGLSPEMDAPLIAVEFAIFAVEYILRLVCSPRPLDYAFSFWGIVGFIAIGQAVLFVFPDRTTARAMRLFRLLRILKSLKAHHALDRTIRATHPIPDHDLPEDPETPTRRTRPHETDQKNPDRRGTGRRSCRGRGRRAGRSVQDRLRLCRPDW